MKITIHSTRGIKGFAFGEGVTAREATAAAVRVFGFPPENRYGLLLSCNTSTPLRDEQRLESYATLDGATLFLTLMDCHAFHVE